jgi:hypothetical protein
MAFSEPNIVVCSPDDYEESRAGATDSDKQGAEKVAG